MGGSSGLLLLAQVLLPFSPKLQFSNLISLVFHEF